MTNRTKIKYTPNKSDGYLVPVMKVLSVCAFVMTGVFLKSNFLVSLIIFVTGIALLLLGNVLCDASQIELLFDDNGIEIKNSKHDKLDSFSWAHVQYAYYTKNYRGFECLILSNVALSKEKLKRTVYRNPFIPRIYHDGVAKIYIEECNVSEIKEVVARNVLNVNVFSEV